MASLLRTFLVVLAALCCCHSSYGLVSRELSRSRLVVEDGGLYQNLLIFINHPPKSNVEQYIQTIQNQVTELSRSLHTLVGLQFSSVDILLPASWYDIDGVERARYNLQSDNADIKIQESYDFEEPFTQHILGCGKTALFMNVGREYITNSYITQSDKTRRLLHEWMHTRYGVFDEHPVMSSPVAVDRQKFYHSSSGKIEAVRCSLDLMASTDCMITEYQSYADLEPTVSLPKERCTYTISEPNQPESSLMSNYEVDKVDELCDDDMHNYEAPNRHNRLCGNMSVTAVLRQHRDFRSVSAMSTKPFSPPSYRILQQDRIPRTVVFILDASNSMDGSRLELAVLALKIMIADVLEDSVRIIVVAFDGNARLIIPANEQRGTFELSSPESRLEAAGMLDGITTGAFTCIGCGFERAYRQVIEDPEDSSRLNHAYFILLTDGKETESLQKVEAMFNRSIAESLIIDTILLGTEAEVQNIEVLAEMTNSRIYSASVDQNSLIDGFLDLISYRQAVNEQVVKIYSHPVRLAPRDSFEDVFKIEKRFYDSAHIYLYWNASDADRANFQFTVTRQTDGEVIVDLPVESDTSDYIKLDISSYEVSQDFVEYEYRLQNNRAASTRTVTVQVTANDYSYLEEEADRKRRSADFSNEYQSYGMEVFVVGSSSHTIQPEELLEPVTIHAYLPVGSVPTTPESVTAYVVFEPDAEGGEATEISISLHDTGTTAVDVIGADGVYSGYFSHFLLENGTYSIRVLAKGKEYTRYGSSGFFSTFVSPLVTSVSDLLPPASIVDLQVMEVTANDLILTFTSSGEDYMSGTATDYNIWFASSIQQLRTGNDSLLYVKTQNNTAEAGVKITISVSVPEELGTMNQTVWIAVTAVDRYGLEANLSNVVSARYIPIPSATSTTTTTKATLPMYIVYAITGLFIMCILIIIIVILTRRQWSKQRDRDIDQKKVLDSGASSAISEEEIGDPYLPLPDICIISNPEDQKYSTYRANPLPSTKPTTNPNSTSIKSVPSKYKNFKANNSIISSRMFQPKSSVKTSKKDTLPPPYMPDDGKITPEFADDLTQGEEIAKSMMDRELANTDRELSPDYHQ